MGFVYGAGGRTLPKAGILGSGAFYKTGHHPSKAGNVFGANWDAPLKLSQVKEDRSFGDPTPSLIQYNSGRARNDATSQQFPLNTHFQRASYNKLSIMTHARADASGAWVGVEPVTQAQQTQLWETTCFVHGRVSVKRPAFRVTGGVNNSLKSDTAFQRRPPATRAKAQPQTAGDTSLYHGSRERIETGLSSYRVNSHFSGAGGQLWGDPNQSFIAGRKQAVSGRVGMSRWAVKKRSASDGR